MTDIAATNLAAKAHFCKGCRRTLPLYAFNVIGSPNRRSVVLNPFCKQCMATQQKRWLKNNKVDPNLVQCARLAIERMHARKHSSERKRRMIHDLTVDDIVSIYILQGGKCALSGQTLRLQSHDQCGSGRGDPLVLSVDRIDSSLGYTRDNIQLVGIRFNLMKGPLTNKEFFDWCRIVTENNKDRGDDLLEALDGACGVDEAVVQN